MSRLAVTLIDVGWGDSILIESEDAAGDVRYALIDSNDTNVSRSSFLFVKRYLERQGVDVSTRFPVFDFVLLTHGHADHSNGIQRMFSEFGTDWFWYPKSDHAAFTKLLSYANRFTQKVARHQAIDLTKQLPDLGDVSLSALWPPNTNGPFDTHNENNNSVVLALTLGQTVFVLSGDCEAENWPQIVPTLPANLRILQIPHHGARNGVFDSGGVATYLDQLPAATELIMSSHIRPHNHPHPDVIAALDARGRTYYRTDEHYHITLETDGTTVTAKYSH